MWVTCVVWWEKSGLLVVHWCPLMLASKDKSGLFCFSFFTTRCFLDLCCLPVLLLVRSIALQFNQCSWSTSDNPLSRNWEKRDLSWTTSLFSRAHFLCSLRKLMSQTQDCITYSCCAVQGSLGQMCFPFFKCASTKWWQPFGPRQVFFREPWPCKISQALQLYPLWALVLADVGVAADCKLGFHYLQPWMSRTVFETWHGIYSSELQIQWAKV